MRCLGAPIALLWRFRELPEDLASYGPLPGLLSAAASLLFSCSFVAFSVLLRSLHFFLFVEIILLFAPSSALASFFFIYSSVFREAQERLVARRVEHLALLHFSDFPGPVPTYGTERTPQHGQFSSSSAIESH